jgi:Uma2 family endonuclease
MISFERQVRGVPMTVVISPPASLVQQRSGVSRRDTFADLLSRLGNVPLDRVLLTPAPGTATVDDALRHPLCELIEGTLVEKAMSYFESRLAMILVRALETFLEQHPFGYVVGPDAQTYVTGDRILIPDVSFVRWKRTSNHEVSDEPIGSIVPDLAVEVLSPSKVLSSINTSGEIEAKRRELFEGGTRLMWVLDPTAERVEVFTSIENRRLLTASQSLDGGDVLPGFHFSIREWLDRARHGTRKNHVSESET